MEGIDATYVINMDRSTERMAFMSSQCRQLGIPFQRIPAIDGSKFKNRANLTTKSCQHFCTDAVIGCALSHMRAWHTVLQEGHERVLILEDDAVLVSDFRKRMKQALLDVPPDFDVMLCGCLLFCERNRKYGAFLRALRPFVTIERNDSSRWGSVFVPEHFGGTHCYVVTKKGCRALLNAIPRVHFHIDQSMNHPDIKLYAVSPDMAVQRDMSDSTISSYKFPKTLAPLFENISVDKTTTLAYQMDVPYCQVGGRTVNAWTFTMFALGLLSRWTFAPVMIFFAIEIVAGGDVFIALLAYCLGWISTRVGKNLVK